MPPDLRCWTSDCIVGFALVHLQDLQQQQPLGAKEGDDPRLDDGGILAEQQGCLAPAGGLGECAVAAAAAAAAASATLEPNLW